ncbi:MAG: hypothetical protein JWL72_405, partial [Ilumatobacteraceae bacterium]|nr:hypothetical protein [Ilumatobacteraceae bacterium]
GSSHAASPEGRFDDVLHQQRRPELRRKRCRETRLARSRQAAHHDQPGPRHALTLPDSRRHVQIAIDRSGRSQARQWNRGRISDRLHIVRFPAILIIVALTCSSCASSSSRAPASTSPTTVLTTTSATVPTASTGLSTTTTSPPSFSPVQEAFAASSYEDSSGEHLLVSGPSIVVEFSVEGSRNIIGWTGGCNSLGTTYTIRDGHLRLDKVVESTSDLCDQALMDQDDLLSRVLANAPEVEISATSMRLSDSRVSITFAPTTKGASSLTP